MNIRVLYFASLRERLGTAQEHVLLQPGSTVAHLVAALVARGGHWASAFAPGQAYRVAVNQDMAAATTPLADGAEVALFPPVTGG
jgi:sulfur-carrier protein